MVAWVSQRVSAARLQLLDSIASPVLVLAFFLSALTLFSFNILITNYHILLQAPSLSLAWYLLAGSMDSIMPVTLALIVINSLLGGVLVALLVKGVSLRLAQSPARSGLHKILGVAGVAAGMGLPSCATCGLGLLSALGYGGVLLLLPFRGLELSVLAAAFLLFSILQLSYALTYTSCDVKK